MDDHPRTALSRSESANAIAGLGKSTGRRIRLAMLSIVTLLAAMSIAPTAMAAYGDNFGIAAFSSQVLDQNADPEMRAGVRPHSVTTSFDLNRNTTEVPGTPLPDGFVKDVAVELPPGMIGNPQVIPVTCSLAELVAQSASDTPCPIAAQVGLATVTDVAFGMPFALTWPIFSMDVPSNVPARFGFSVLGTPVLLDASIRSGSDYGITMTSQDSSQGIQVLGVSTTFWGVPADPIHDPQRGHFFQGCGVSPFSGTSVGSCPANVEPRPFLSNPTRCSEEPLNWAIEADSWVNPGVFDRVTISEDVNGNPFRITECDELDFDPVASAQPTTLAADAPSGLDVKVVVPQDQATDRRATPHVKQIVMELPEGMAVNPSSANGLGSCSPAQVSLDDADPHACPNNARIGTVEIDTPLLEKVMRGGVYVAEQDNNPFGSTLALYLTAQGPGVNIKLPGEISLDENTGRIVASFDNNPELPFDSLTVRLKGDERAPLVSPPTCGTYDITTKMVPWSAADPNSPTPEEIVTSTSEFTIDRGPAAGPCPAGDPHQPGDPSNLGDRPFGPTMNAGITNPVAGSLSPFTFRLTRDDGEQEILSTSVTPPEGVTAKLAGVPLCSNQRANAGNCPAASQVGETIVGAGAGPSPFYIQAPDQGKVFMTGPYKGEQLGMLIQVPAKAGPFDLGMVNVRAAVAVDKRTAQLTVKSDPIPQIIEGIPLRVKDIRVKVNRPDFTIAPTNCDPMAVGATVQGSHGASANLTNRFQVGDCASLGFNPKLKLDFGKKRKNTKRNAHPPLHANLSFNEGDANISSVEVALPKGVLLDQARLGRICSRANYAAETCPEESRVGYAKATTPLLDNPVEGTVYLKSSDNPLPDLAADLNGQIDIDLFGKIDQKENKKGLNQIRNTFDVVPDVPVSHFQLTLDGGNDGLLVNSKNICKRKRTQRVRIEIEAHNEATLKERSRIGSACKKINKKKAKRLKKKAKKVKRKAKKTKKKARKASGKKATKLERKSKKLNKKAKKLKRQARKLGR